MSAAESRLEVVPIRPAVCADGSTVLEVLVRVLPPARATHDRVRPPLNLALVLDRSGSMAGARKLPYAIEAACYVVGQMQPTDRLAVTIFDECVETIVPAAPVTDPAAVQAKLRQVEPRGSTDLYAGWAEGGHQVRRHRGAGALNRVILLSDGQANQGVTDARQILGGVRDLAAGGVSTTTLGLGRDYNEELLEGMAEAGDGNYYFIETPVQLPDLFASELHGLIATVGQKVSLGVTVAGGGQVREILNDFPRLTTGRVALPPLSVGQPVPVLVRLELPAWPAGTPGPLASFRLAWDPAGGGPRQTRFARLDLPSIATAAWQGLAEDPTVREQVALLEAARAQKAAGDAIQAGDLTTAQQQILAAREMLGVMPLSSAALDHEDMDRLERIMAEGDLTTSSKLARMMSYSKRRGRGPEGMPSRTPRQSGPPESPPGPGPDPSSPPPV